MLRFTGGMLEFIHSLLMLFINPEVSQGSIFKNAKTYYVNYTGNKSVMNKEKTKTPLQGNRSRTEQDSAFSSYIVLDRNLLEKAEFKSFLENPQGG